MISLPVKIAWLPYQRIVFLILPALVPYSNMQYEIFYILSITIIAH